MFQPMAGNIQEQNNLTKGRTKLFVKLELLECDQFLSLQKNIGRSLGGGGQTSNKIAADISLQPTWQQAVVPWNAAAQELRIWNIKVIYVSSHFLLIRH